jgi:F-type H+-transporting ATPase subunit b
MELIERFGVDPILLVAQIINFLIILFLLKKFLYKPVLDMLRKREDDIKNGIKQAEEGRITLEKSLDEGKNILKLAQTQAKKVMDDAKDQASKTALEIEENARTQAEKLLKEAREQIEEDTKKAEQALSKKVVDLSKEMTTKSIGQFFSKKEETNIIAKALKQIEKDK